MDGAETAEKAPPNAAAGGEIEVSLRLDLSGVWASHSGIIVAAGSLLRATRNQNGFIRGGVPLTATGSGAARSC